MRTINKLFGVAFTALLFVIAKPAQTQAQPGVEVSYQTFYDELSPYGTWVDDPDYGDVWVPDVEDGFQPYATRGHWVVTEYGNTWVSDYEWGWAPFHYGRWRFDDYYGWEWIPGSEWGPAWVNWRTGGDYYAWAPLGPRISIDISFGNNYIVPDDYWICAPRGYINNPRIYDYYVPRNRVVAIIRNTTIINNVYVNNNRRFVSGPRTQDIERYTGRPVRVYGLNNSSRPGATIIQNNTVNVYRPNVIRNNRGDDRPRPTRVVDASAYRNQHPNEGIANRNNGATIRHDNASRLAQTARTEQPENSGVVRVNRPGTNSPASNGNNNNRPGRDNGNPATPNNDRFNHNNGTGAQPNQPINTGTPVNTTPNNPNNNWRGNRGNGTTNQPAPANQPDVKPTVVPNNPNPTTPTPNPGRFNRNGNRPSQAGPNAQPQQPVPAVMPQQQNQDQAAAQQRQQQEQARQQQMQQQRQQQEQARQAQQQRQQQQPQAQPQRQPQQQQPQQQQPQRQPQQRPQAQPQQQPQQRPQAQPQQQRPQPQPQQQPRPQRQPEKPKDEKPPM